VGLEEEVGKLMSDPVERTTAMLEAPAGDDPSLIAARLSDRERLEVVVASLAGLREAVLRLAREIDQMRAG
jgi:hypothetical protein